MATWADVERLGLTLPDTVLGEAHEGSPAVLVRGRQFERLRRDDAGSEVLQFWVPDADLVSAHVEADPATYWDALGYSRKVVLARLSALDLETLREHLVESWCCRAPEPLRNQHPGVR